MPRSCPQGPQSLSSWTLLWVCAWEPVSPTLWERPPNSVLVPCFRDCGCLIHRAAGNNFLSWCSQYKALPPHHPGCVLFSDTYFLTGPTLLMGSHTPDSPFPTIPGPDQTLISTHQPCRSPCSFLRDLCQGMKPADPQLLLGIQKAWRRSPGNPGLVCPSP